MPIKYEFKVVPVPARCDKEARSSGEDPIAATLETALNALTVEGWEFHCSEMIQMRKGGWLLGRRTLSQSVLVFRRARPVKVERPTDVREQMERTRNRKPAQITDETAAARRVRPILPAPAAAA